MSSPFPGMDPYLEHPDFWAEVHSRLIIAIADFLVPYIRPKYRVAIKKRIYEVSETDGDNLLLVGIPGTAVNRQPTNQDLQKSNIAMVSPAVQPVTITLPMPGLIKQSYLQVQELATGQVVTAIEILSPVNKRSGGERAMYLKKRQKILGSLTHLVEIDLLRGWHPMPTLKNDIQTDYRILVSREACRPQADLYGFSLQEPIPTFSLPLRSEDIEPVVDLQALLNEIYDQAGYDYVIDYRREPVPPLSKEDSGWVNNLLQNKGLQ
ncbi:MAG: DUF4058 family protein [Symploca sp. SIO2C1]|nr:DUF4058 family protein [Symploca sp. SIO2C1]